MIECFLCQTQMREFIDDIRDWEYGVEWSSGLVKCPDCGLVSHEPAIKPTEIPTLYPSNYLAHSPAATSTSLYGKLKSLLAQRTVRQIAASVPQGGSFLEIGCGNGHLLRQIAATRPDIKLIGVDIENTKIAQLPNFEFHHGQFEEVSIKPSSVDLIYCSNLIEHVPDPLIFAKKMFSTLRPGGAVLGITPDHLSIDRYVFGKYWAGYHFPRHTFVFNHRNIRNVLSEAGLVDITVNGAYSFWYLSFANRFVELPGTKKRGLLFAVITALFLPFDLLVNAFRVHGSMTFRAKTPRTEPVV